MRKPFLLIGAAIALLIVVAIVIATRRHAEPAAGNAAVATPLPTTPPVATLAPAPAEPPLVGPGGFVPLQSQAVKDAIHTALVTGATQRWQDGALAGYAVPSATAGANGCRAIRYTIDQQPGAYGSITACDASGR